MKLYSGWPKFSAFLSKKNSLSVVQEIDSAFTPGNYQYGLFHWFASADWLLHR